MKIRLAHSPAPWLVDDDDPGHITTVQGEAIADCHLVYSAIDSRECLANARLIAQAPEMYSLLLLGLNAGVFDASPSFMEDVVSVIQMVEGTK